VALVGRVGHATGEWEEGGEGVQGGGRGKRKIQELAGRERGGGKAYKRARQWHDNIPYIYLGNVHI
jgi:hypothetical protein